MLFTRRVVSFLAVSLSCWLLVFASGCSYDDPYAVGSDGRTASDQQYSQRDRYATQAADQQRALQRDQSAMQQRSEDQAAGANAGTRTALAFPTGDRGSSVVMLEAVAPPEVRVGQPYTYTLRVTNLTDAPLHNVVVRDLAAAGAPTTQPSDRRSASNNDFNSGDQAQLASHQMNAAATTTNTSSAAGWSVGTLAPHQTLTQQFTATPEEVGTVRNCLSVSYQPTLCMAVNVVQPELQLTKEAPSDAMICQDIVYNYTVTNTGSGTAQGVHIEDALPDGLSLTDGGGRTFSADIGNLGQGQSKRVTARVRASKTGQFTSRATARAASDLQAQTGDVTTTVRAPVLAVNLDAPRERFVGEAIDYHVTVKNTGDAPAQQTVVRLTSADGQRLADKQIGTIPPGESRDFPVSIRSGRTGGTIRTQAIADAKCAQRATGEATVSVKTVPALRMECVDQTDPVRVNSDTVYTITVKNQGSGPDSNIALHATLPPEEQFVSANGASKVSANGQDLTFAPLTTLGPGETAQWTVEVRALRAGDVKFWVEMKSDSLGQQAAQETEPTRLLE